MPANPLYVGPYLSSSHEYTSKILAYLTGEKMNVATREDCNALVKNKTVC